MRLLLAAAIALMAAPVLAQGDQKIDRLTIAAHQHVDFDTLQWFPDPSLPNGAVVSPLAGDPSKAGPFLVYVKLPAGSVIAPHTHPYAEVVTILKGSAGNGFGKSFDKAKGSVLSAGSSMLLPAGHAHYMWSDEEVVALLVASGPWNITYVNPKDDPRNK